ncbi:hypothetical protein K503DRAFT_780748 [Rhizopogon vinicolor AM-OR11-026]|uniref:Uncharacterized protein n=1 Tax=Rhizopogon vinicolor AM-OR11-026 TaxID=1314800 RepID=A0A1B7N8Z2_9AGAM|nr:hypothetical protein K503DRAFT_780748 [Rhizopogon vinicolor AM-OR11-026]
MYILVVGRGTGAAGRLNECRLQTKTGELLVSPIKDQGNTVTSVIWSSYSSKLYPVCKRTQLSAPVGRTVTFPHTISQNVLACVGNEGIAQFKVYLRQVELYDVSRQVWLSKKCQYQIFQFFTECIKPKSTWILLKPYVDSLVANFTFPQLTFNASKQAMWEDDPVEYVRASIGAFIRLLSNIHVSHARQTTNRTPTSLLPILQFINIVLRLNPSPVQRFGALTMIAVLGPFIVRHPDVKRGLKQFMVQHVLPEFTAQEAYLRSVILLGVVTKAGITWLSEEQTEEAPDNINVESLVSEGDDHKVYGAMGVTKTIGTEVIMPIILFTLENKLIEMLPSLGSFMSYGTEVLKARPDHRQKVFGMYRTALTGPQLGDNGIITIAADHIDTGEMSSFRLAILDILVNAVLYNASAVLHFMEAYKPGFARVFFYHRFAAINGENKLPRVHDKKLTILALCKLLEMNAVLIPDGLWDGWPGIVVGALNIFKTLPQAVASA